MMKKLNKLFLILTLTIITSQLFGQTFGLRLGSNFSNQLIENDNGSISDAMKLKNLIGVNLGFNVDIPVYKGFSIEPGLLFNTKGYKIDESNSGSEYKASNYLFYIDLPVNLKYTFNLGGPKLYLAAGPYFAYGVFGKGSSTATILGIKTTDEWEINWGTEATDDYKPFDIGLNAGGGFQFRSFVVGATYGFGLKNISPVTDNGMKINNKVLSISIGVNLAM